VSALAKHDPPDRKSVSLPDSLEDTLATWNEETARIVNSSDSSGFSPTFKLDPDTRYQLVNPNSMDAASEPEESVIGRGGFGRVMAAFDCNVGRAIAVKELVPERMSTGFKRFLFEARLTGQLDHPSIVPVYEIGQRKDGSFYYTMKLIKGRTLADAIKGCETLSDRLKLLHHFVAICHAIGYAHARSVIHRDIKSNNVMLGDFGETVVLDWGLAKLVGVPGQDAADDCSNFEWLESNESGGPINTMDGTVIGTPYYMSPEQASGYVDQLGPRSDVWSLGAVLYEILTGKKPFAKLAPHRAVEAVRTEAIPSVKEKYPDTPVELSAIADKALSLKDTDRYTNANEMADELEAYRAGDRVGAYEYNSLELLGKFVRKNKAVSAITCVAILCLFAASIFIFNAYKKAELARQQEQHARMRSQSNEMLSKYNLSGADYEKGRRYLNDQNHLLASLFSSSALTNNPTNPAGQLYPVFQQTLAGRLSTEQLILQQSVYFQSSNQGFVEFFGRIETAQDFIRDVAFTPESQTVVAAFDDGTEGAVTGYFFQTMEKGKTIHRHKERALSVAISNNGRWIASGGRGRTIKIWDQYSEEPLEEISVSAGAVEDIGFSPDDRILAIAGDKIGIELYRLSDMRNISNFARESFSGKSIDFAPDKSRIASAHSDGFIRIWSVPDGKMLSAWEGHSGLVRSVDYSPDGSLIATAGDDKTARIWNASTGELLNILRDHDDWVWKAIFTPKGDALITSSRDYTIRFWNVPDFECVSTLKLSEKDGNPSTITVSANGRFLASAGYGNAISLWRIDREPRTKTFRGNQAVVLSTDISSDGSTFAATTLENTLLWSTTDQKKLVEIEGSGNIVRTSSFSPDGKYLATGGDDRIVHVYRQRETTPIANLKGHADKILDVAFSPAGKVLASAGKDRTVRLWSAVDFKPVVTLEGHEKEIHCIAFSKNGKMLASGDWDGVLKLWDVADPTNPSKMHTMSQKVWVTRIAFFPDGARVITADQEGQLRIWDTTSGEMLHEFSAHSKWINDVDISPDSRWIVTGSDDRTLKVWDASDWSKQLHMEFPSEVTCASFTPDGSQFAFNDGSKIIFYPTDFSNFVKNPDELLAAAEKAAGVEIRRPGS
jgi:eukaryotic-like serine/threonine-protein kinase